MTSAHGFEHVAVIHDGPADLAARVVPSLRTALASGDSVLVCLDDLTWQHVSAALGDASSAVTYTPAQARYARPSTAMAMVHRFAQDALERGARTAWSLGAIAFDGSPADDRWHRYEAAVNDVLRDLPLKGICGYDRASVPTSVIEAALRTHALVDDVDGRHPSPAFAADVAFGAIGTGASITTGLGAPDQLLVIEHAAGARRALAAAYGSLLSSTQLDDALLAATELVTNGLRHGLAPVTFESWCTPGGDIILRVSDDGGGIADPYPELRPPAVGLGGYGLWVVGQVCDDVFVDRVDGRTVITARLVPS